MKKISTPLAITIIVILAILLIGGVFIYQYRFSLPEIPFIPKVGVSFSNDCNKLIQQINDLVEKANYCSSDSDCLISTETTKFCGCWSLINKNADLAKIKEGNEKYIGLNCPVLMCGECMLLPTQGDIKCSNNKCVDGRNLQINKNLEQCIEASSLHDYLQKAKVEPWGNNEVWKVIKSKDIPVPVNISGIEIFQVPISAAGGDILTTTVIKSGNKYCKLTDKNAQILFAPIKKEQSVKYLIFRLNTLASSGFGASQVTILERDDYGETDEERIFCVDNAKIDFSSVEKKITTVEETADGYLINWVFFTEVGKAGYYEERIKIGTDAKIQILEWPKTPFINCGSGIVF